jgi:mono/diheme cytochrome c family protein
VRTARQIVFGVAISLAALAAMGLVYLRTTGLSARGEPAGVEAALAREARSFAIPSSARARPNPVPPSPDALADGMEHYADHCAVCHANDGSGKTEMGQGLFPKAPDMRLAATQQLTDGELFYVIENGIRFTGMPAWSTGTPGGEDSTWKIVTFIRHLPKLTADEIEKMKQLNPRSPEEIRHEIEEDRFLNEGAPR